MNQKKARPNSFFIEIIIVLLFFSLSAAVILQVFVSAHQKSTLSNEQNLSMVKAQELTEEFKAYSEPGRLLGFLADTEIASDSTGASSAEILLGKDWKPSSSPKYILHITVTPEQKAAGTLLHSEVSVVRAEQKQDVLYQLETNKYVPAV